MRQKGSVKNEGIPMMNSRDLFKKKKSFQKKEKYAGPDAEKVVKNLACVTFAKGILQRSFF